MATTKLENGILSYESGFLFWKKSGSIKLNEVDYVVPRQGWILSHYIHIGKRNGEAHKVRISKKLTSTVLEQAQCQGAPLGVNLDNVIEFDNSTSDIKSNNPKAFNKNNLWLTEDVVIYVPKRKILSSDDSPVCIPINDVRFSTTYPQKKWKIIPNGHGTYFGTPSHQAVFLHPKIEHSDRLLNHMKERGAKIGMKSDNEFKDTFWFGKIFKPLLFLRKETIGFNKEGVLYTFKKGKKTETIFLPYDGIKYANLKKGFFHSNNIEIIGEQNIFTHLQFSNKAIKLIKEELATKNIKQAKLILNPRMILGLFRNPLANRSLAVTDDMVTYTDKKTKNVVVFNFDEINDIAWKKKYFFYFVGYLFIEGSANNFRRDQVDLTENVMVIPKIWYTKKNIIKKAVGADYNRRDFKKLCTIKDVKYS